MKKRYLLFSILFIILFLGIGYPKVYAKETDQIENMTITVDPGMDTASLDIQYEITWKVLDTSKEGPLSSMKIRTPNFYFDHETALTDNIKSIYKHLNGFRRANRGNVLIKFKRSYEAGESLTFKYAIRQLYAYRLSGSKCKFEFTSPAFQNAKIDNVTIKWNANSVEKSNNQSQEENYLVWNKKNLRRGEKLKVKVTYPKSAFSSVTLQVNKATVQRVENTILLILFITFIIYLLKEWNVGDDKRYYYKHRGFYESESKYNQPRYYGKRMRKKL